MTRACSVALVAFFAALALPLPARALPGPFGLVFVADLLLQLVALAAVLLPLGLERVRLAIHRRVRRQIVRRLLVVGLVVLAGWLAVVRGAPGRAFAGMLGRALAPGLAVEPGLAALTPDSLPGCSPLAPALAARLGLPVGALIVDVRPAPQFLAYYLEGSCHVPLQRLREADAALRAVLETGTPILLATHEPVSPEAVFGGGVPEPLRGLRFASLPGGLQAFAGTDGPGRTGALVFGGANPGVLRENARVVSVAILGSDASWRQLPEAMVPAALAEGRPVLDLRPEPLRGPGGLPSLSDREATLAAAEQLLGTRADGVLFVCDAFLACLAAEGIAWELRREGRPVSGYVRSFRPGAELASMPFTPPSRTAAASLALLFACALWALLAAAVGDRLAAGARRSGRRRLVPLALLLARASGLALVPLAWWATPSFTAEAGSVTPAVLMLVDLRRVGLGFLLALLPVVLAATAVTVEEALGRASLVLRFCLVALFSLWMLEEAGLPLRETSLLDCLLPAAGILSLAAWPSLRALGARRRLHAAGPRIAALGDAALLPHAGGKVRGLALAEEEGLPIPASAVLLVDAGGVPADAWPGLVAEVSGRLGPGPYVVRSSAPDEDAETTPTPGRYVSAPAAAFDALPKAVDEVLASYRSTGLVGEVAVLVQPRLDGRWAGVAVREPSARGGGILVEASRGSAVPVTAGEGAERRARIGAWSRAWLEAGDRDDGDDLVAALPAKQLLRVFERLEAALRQPLDLEWTLVRGRLVVLQARAAPREDIPFNEAASLLAQLTPSLGWVRGQPHRRLLVQGDFAELAAGTSAETVELLAALWHPSGPAGREAAQVLPGLKWVLPVPAVVQLEGAAYACTLNGNPLRAWAGTRAARLHGLLLRLRLPRLLARLDERLRVEEGRLPVPAEASSPRAARNALLGEPARIAASVQLLQRLRTRTAVDPDPLLVALASGRPIDPADPLLAFRAIPDLALERPRLAESSGLEVQVPGRLDAPPLPSDPDEALAMMRARARVVVAAHAACLRSALAREGRLPVPVEASPGLPAVVTLAALESWAATGRPLTESRARHRGVWAGASFVGEARVGTEVVIERLATASAFAAVPPEVIVISPGGSALCHAALVARQRGLRALFDAGDEATLLGPGDRVRLQADGSWERVVPGHEHPVEPADVLTVPPGSSS